MASTCINPSAQGCGIEGARNRVAKVLVSGYLLLCFTFLMSLAFMCYWAWDSSENRGYHFGYWGALNRMVAALENMPGISVESAAGNEDVTLEEFAVIMTVGEKSVRLFFDERDPIRRLKGEALQAALQQRIADTPEQAP